MSEVLEPHYSYFDKVLTSVVEENMLVKINNEFVKLTV